MKRRILAGLATVLLTAAALAVVLRLWKADLAVPFQYQGDALESGLLVKGVVDNGWRRTNAFVGMPYGLDERDLRLSDDFHLFTIKLIALFISDWARILNIFFLTTFPLTALSALFVFRSFKLSYAPSIAGSLLYAFLPYHFFWAESQAFLAAYYAVPLAVMVALWLCSGAISLTNSRGDYKALFSDNKFIAGIAISLLLASSGLYYAFFACFFLAVAGVKGSLAQRDRGPLLSSLFLVLTIVVAGLFPSLRYQRVNGINGMNPFFAASAPDRSEAEGLKIAQMLLPVDDHRIPALAAAKAEYDLTAPLVNENRSASLGLAGGLGFVLLIAAAVFRKKNTLGSELLEHLSVLNLAGVLYATIGGFGSVIAYTLFSDLPSLNRISVFLAFFSLFAVVIALDKLLKRFGTGRLSTAACRGLIAVVAVLGICDQTTSVEAAAPSESAKTAYLGDARFVAAIEAAMPERAMIFQLPNMPFPSTLPAGRMERFEPAIGYLHSKTLRWSYRMMRGRERVDWDRRTASKPLKEFLETIAAENFKGVYIDRRGYPDNAAALESKLSALLGIRPITSADQRRSFFDLSGYKPGSGAATRE